MWKCVKCSEEVEDNFDTCWSCGTAPDGTEDPHFGSSPGTPPTLAELLESERSTLDLRNCPSCGKDAVLNDMQLMERHLTPTPLGGTVAYIDGEPSALFFKERLEVELRLDVCISCGETKLRVADLMALRDACRYSED